MEFVTNASTLQPPPVPLAVTGLEPGTDEIILSVENLSKKFCRSLNRSLFYGIQEIVDDVLIRKGSKETLREGEFWALRNVSLKLKRGTALGLIGANGSGKTTLMRVISGIIKPTSGRVSIRGRVAPLLALTAGFNPLLTGRENIYLNMSILGLSREEINEAFEEVVEFSEIDYALDAPVQTYSSGMAARLGFSCAIHTNPDILLIDEVLAVGDLSFRTKCQHRLKEMREGGTSFVMVHHSPQIILALCSSAVYLSGGNLVLSGDPQAVVNKYEEDVQSGNITQGFAGARNAGVEEFSKNDFKIRGVRFRSKSDVPMETPLTGETTQLCVEFRAARKIGAVNFVITVVKVVPQAKLEESMPEAIPMDTPVLWFAGHLEKQRFVVQPGDYELRIELPSLGLTPGGYRAKVEVHGPRDVLLAVWKRYEFTVESNILLDHSLYFQQRIWNLVQLQPPEGEAAKNPAPPDGEGPNAETSAPTSASADHVD